MSGQFDYLLNKIESAPFQDVPFRHVEIQSFLLPEHFQAIVTDPQVALSSVASTEELLNKLTDSGYVFLHFPGCVSSIREYLDFQKGKSSHNWHKATEGFGIVYRLMEVRSQILKDLDAFFRSEPLQEVLKKKFGIERTTTIDTGLQKYLDGYEISPHPDIRRKALTWMLNINPGQETEKFDFHTHYLKLNPEWAFIYDFWKANPEFDRDWLPWNWCNTVKQQRTNNSIVFFSPSDDTIHAVKARYDHLGTQRTQMYGNLWYEKQALPKVYFEHFDIASRVRADTGPDAVRAHTAAQRGPVAFASKAIRKIRKKLTKPEQGGYRAVEF